MLDDTATLQESVVISVLHLQMTLETTFLLLAQVCLQLGDIHTATAAEHIDAVIVIEEERGIVVETLEVTVECPALGRVFGGVNP